MKINPRIAIVTCGLLVLAAWGCGGTTDAGKGAGAGSAGAGPAPTGPPAASTAPAEADWITYSPADGGYSVLVPAQPEEATQKEPAGDGKELVHHIASLIKKPNVYIVDYFDIDYDVPADDPGKFYDIMRDGNIEARKAKVVEEHEITVDGVKARERVDEQDPGKGVTFVMKTRSILAGRRFYVVTASGPKGALNMPDADRFLDSFHLTRAAAAPAQSTGTP
jgi:hypothetical protein